MNASDIPTAPTTSSASTMTTLRAGPLIIAMLVQVLALGCAGIVLFIVPFPAHELTVVARCLGALAAALLVMLIAWRIAERSLRKIEDGVIHVGAPGSMAYSVMQIWEIYVWGSLLTTSMLSAPLKTALIRSLGGRLAPGAMCAGAVLDPPLTHIGKGTLVGAFAVLTAHTLTPTGLYIGRIHIGERVLVGGNSVILPNVTIGDDAVVAAGAVVTSGTVIGPGEKWGGVPARKLGG